MSVFTKTMVAVLGTFLLGGTPALGVCPSPRSTYVRNSGSCSKCLQHLGSDYPDSVDAHYWIQGQGDLYNSGTLGTGMFSPLESGYFFLSSTWTEPQTVGCPDNVIPVDARCVQVTSTPSGYILQSVVGGMAGPYRDFDFDDTLSGVLEPIPIPVPGINGEVTADAEYYYVPIAWSPALDLQGVYDSPPSGNLVTGIRVRYAIATLPPPQEIALWPYISTTVDVSSGPDPQNAVAPIPKSALPPGGEAVWLCLSLVFDNGAYETPFPGPASFFAIVPTPAGVLATTEARLAKGWVTVSWRTNVESGTARFVVEAARSAAGPFAELPETETEPRGDHSFYSATFRNPYPKARAFFVRVKSVDFDGGEFAGNPVKVVRHPYRPFNTQTHPKP